MTDFKHSCESNAQSISPDPSGPSRRAFFSAIAVTATSLGLTAIATSAQAASKKYKICATKDIKVGGGSIFKISAANGLQVLITQPKPGVFRAFNPACTHQGFRLNSISGSNIICPIHRAQFDTTTGNVTRGPAQLPLVKYNLNVEGNNIFVTLNS